MSKDKYFGTNDHVYLSVHIPFPVTEPSTQYRLMQSTLDVDVGIPFT
jgi:hypothetical protein